MKKLTTVFSASVIGTALISAHEMEGGSKAGLLGLKPEYVHVLLNPLPVYGLAIGVFVLACAMLARGKISLILGLVLIVISSASAWPVLYYGQHGYNQLFPQIDTDSQKWLNEHMERAERSIYVFYVTAVFGVAALGLRKRFPKVGSALAGLTLACAIMSVGIGTWISRAGGQVSHSEFRNEEAPLPPPDHGHQGHSVSEEKIQQPEAGNHRHGGATRPNEFPDTPEGIWTEIHKHHSDLAGALRARQLGNVPAHTDAIRQLNQKLAQVVHPDHKAAVQASAEKVNHALDALRQSADAGDGGAAETSFKQLEDSLRELEELMKKQ